MRKNIKNNEKRIALIRRGIKNDNDDSRYHLEEFDAEIDRLENLHEDVQERQKKALEEFEGNIKQGIQQEILQSAQETKDKLAHDYQVVKGDFGYNARADKYEDLRKAGIIDPAKVARVALENAASIAGLFLTTECLITDKPEPQSAAMPTPQPGMGGMM